MNRFDNETSSRLPSSDVEGFRDQLDAGRLSRKRARESSMVKVEEGLDDHLDMTDDGRPKTRRVNPQRLAVRLGAGLVAEMEALIVPGAKMPTFAVRKDFQERYCVDRRHIYDYFHSRGLRVAKEDKHTNLIRGRALKAAAAASSANETRSSQRSSESTDCGSSVQALRAIPVLTSKLTKPKLKLRAKAKKKTKRAEDIAIRRIFLAPPSSDRYTSPPSSTLPVDFDSHSAAQPCNRPSSPCPELSRPDILSDSSMSQEKSPDLKFFSSPQGHSMNFRPSMEASPMLCGDEPNLFSEPDVFLCQVEPGSLTVDDHLPLNRHERAELYDLISNTLHSTTGIGESAGTYDAYMKGRTSLPYSYNLQIGLGAELQMNQTGESNSCFPFSGHSNEGSNDLIDLGTWLSEELTNFGDNLTGVHLGSGISGDGLSGMRLPYLSEYSGNYYTTSELKENAKHSRDKSLGASHTRMRTTSARGQI